VERSETLGISYQLRSALKLKERHRLPAKKRASVVVPFCKRVRARGYPSHLPVVALWSVPQIYRRDCFSHRATPTGRARERDRWIDAWVATKKSSRERSR
jgi:hypothetical protein